MERPINFSPGTDQTRAVSISKHKRIKPVVTEYQQAIIISKKKRRQNGTNSTIRGEKSSRYQTLEHTQPTSNT